jgi:hypothetical protein
MEVIAPSRMNGQGGLCDGVMVGQKHGVTLSAIFKPSQFSVREVNPLS